MRFTLSQLQAFACTARLGTVHAAAKHLSLTQPAVSNRIRELEDQMSIKLFERHNQRLQVTQAGRNALVYAERVLASAQEMARMDLTDSISGLIRIGVDESCAIVGMPHILRDLKETHPGVRVDLKVGGGAELLEKINHGELDMALHTGRSDQANVTSLFLGWTEHQWVAARDAAVLPGPFTPEQAITQRIVCNPPPSTLNDSMAKWLKSGGFETEEFSRCNSLSLMLSLVLSCHAIAVLPVSIVREHLASGAMRVLDSQPLLPAVAYYLSFPAHHHSATTARLRDIAQRNLALTRFFLPEVRTAGQTALDTLPLLVRQAEEGPEEGSA